jgi:hypothetical protein
MGPPRKEQTREFETALSTFEKLRGTFPALSMNLDLRPAHVDVAMDIPAQPGLCFEVHLNLQNLDELHLVASAFWCEWFPCTNPKKVERYIEAVSGLLSGEFRILEHWRGRRPVKAQLQRPSGSDWENIATWVMCQRSSLGRERPSRLSKTNPCPALPQT